MTPVDVPSTAQGPRFHRSTVSRPVDLRSIPPTHDYVAPTPPADESESAGAPYSEAWKLKGSIAPGLVLRTPLRVRLTWEVEHVVADCEEVNLHAFGADRMDAIVALGERLREHLHYLQEHEARLAPGMRRQLELLRSALLVADAKPEL
jgi:hypothetical protein